MGLQDAASPVMEEFIFFHDFAMVVLIFIIRLVAGITGRMLQRKLVHRGLAESQLLECI